MRILFVRHGQSEGNIDERNYILKGDRGVDLTPLGWQQAIACGKFLSRFYRESDTQKWPTIYLSSYNRPKQTFRGIYESLKEVFPGDPKLYEDVRLIEKFFGAASNLMHPHDKVGEEFAARILKISQLVYQKDPFIAKHLFGESTLETLVRVKGFLDGTFARDVKEGKDDFLFVDHGAVIQAKVISWFHLPMSAKNKFPNPGNCDVLMIEGEPKNWRLRKIYDGERFEAVDIDILEGIRPFSLDDLEPLPEAFRLHL